MCSGDDHGESERRMMPAASSSRNSASALGSLSGSRRRALANPERPVISMVWRILCFGDDFPFPSPMMVGNEASRDRTDGAMEQRAAANLERSVPAVVDGLESGFRVFESSIWRLTGLTSSPWADKKSKHRMGLYTAASKKVTKKVRSPNDRRRRMVAQHGIALPSAPESGWRQFRTDLLTS
jgi:hypothetical protein